MNKRVKVCFNEHKDNFYVCISKSIWERPLFEKWSIAEERSSYANRRTFKKFEDAKEYAEKCLMEAELIKTCNQVFSFSEKVEYKNHTILLCGEDIVYYDNNYSDMKAVTRSLEMAKKLIDFDVDNKKQQVMDKLKGK